MINNQIQSLIPRIAKIERHGSTPIDLHHELINIYCQSNGLSHEILNNYFNPTDASYNDDVVKYCDYSYLALKRLGYLVEDSVFTFHQLRDQYVREGYIILPFRISPSICQAIGYSFLNASACVQHKTSPGMTHYRNSLIPINDGALMYKALGVSIELAMLHSYQSIISFIDMMSDLFASSRHKYILKQRAFVWSLPSLERSENQRSELAQVYHFDLDSLEWQKFFIYLNDVTDSNGPHEYISQTHHVNGKSPFLLRKGYSRHSRASVLDSLESGQIEYRVTGRAGTIFLGNTKCWHRGTEPSTDYRLLMSNVYCSHPVSVRLAS